MKKNQIIAFSFIIIGVVVAVVFTIYFFSHGFTILGKNKINFFDSGQFGAFIGGVVGTLFSLSGTLLIFFSFQEQTKRNRKQEFESKFYEMVRIHNSNVKEIEFRGKKGRPVFKEIVEILQSTYIEVEKILNQVKTEENDLIIQEFNFNPQKIKEYLKKKDDLNLRFLAHKLSYGYFFYGLKGYHLTKDKNDISFCINLIVSIIMTSSRLVPGEDNGELSEPRFNGMLGHYYRHLYQIIKLIAEDDLIKEPEKNKYTKIVRSLLSDYEQILLYYNSLSVMGSKWLDPLNQSDPKKMCLLARFRLIKNIPYYFEYFGVNPAFLFKTEMKAWKSKGKEFFETYLPT